MEKVSKFCLTLFNIIFGVTILFIFKIAIFNCHLFNELKVSKTLISALLILGVVLCLTYLFKNLSKRYLIIISVFSFIILILIQIFFAKNFKVNPSWDFGDVFNEGIKIATKGDLQLPYYFYGPYPNNIGIAFLMAIIFKICNLFGVSNYLEIAILFNIIVIDLAVITLYLFITKLYGYRISTIFSIFILMITPFYTYVPIVYTDTLTMIFPILIFLLYDLYVYSECRFKCLYLIAIGIIIAVGTIIKTNVIIALIALIIYVLLTKKKFKCVFSNLSTLIIPFLIIMTLYNGLVQKVIPIPIEESGFPYTHWIMMGLKYNGGFNHEDPDFTASFSTKEDKKKANIEEIKKRLSNYGIDGYIKFLNKKLIYTWGDGTFYAPEKLRREPMKWTTYHEYIIGNKRMAYLYLSQGSYIVMMFLIIIGVISMFKGKNRFNYLFNICIFGVFLFLIMWETRSRYLVCFLPVFLISASGGLDYLTKIIDKK